MVAMLSRQSNAAGSPPSGRAATSLVTPPPFSHGWATRSTAATTRTPAGSGIPGSDVPGSDIVVTEVEPHAASPHRGGQGDPRAVGEMGNGWRVEHLQVG